MLFLSGTEGACEELTTTTSKIMVHLRGYTYIYHFVAVKIRNYYFFIGHPDQISELESPSKYPVQRDHFYVYHFVTLLHN